MPAFPFLKAPTVLKIYYSWVFVRDNNYIKLETKYFIASMNETIKKYAHDSDNILEALRECDRSELCSLFGAENKDHLVDSIDLLLEEHPDDKILKILWCYIHTNSSILPLPFIASSLNEVIEDTGFLITAPRLSFIIVTLISFRLAEIEEHRISLLLVDKLLSHPLPEYSHTKKEIDNFTSVVSQFIKVEKNKSINRKEPKSYFDFLDELDKKNDAFKEILNKKNNAIPAKDSKLIDIPVTDWKLTKPSGEFEENYKTILANQSNTPEDPESGTKDQNKNLTSKLLYYLILISFPIIFITVIFFFKEDLTISFNNFFVAKDKSIQDFSLSPILSQSSTEPVLPELPLYTQLQSNYKLDKIDERLKNMSNGSSKKETDSDIGDSTDGKIEVQNLEDFDKVEPIIETANMGTEIPEAKPIPPFQGNTKKPESEEIKNDQIEDLGSTDKTEPINPDQRKSPSMRKEPESKPEKYGSPRSYGGQIIKNDQTGIGLPEKEVISSPVVYETITATNVLSAPSLLSPSITRLDVDTPVQVIGKIGFWLEIKSSSGKTGYIYAQDAVKKE